jgi:hypothetical protein
MQSLRLLPIAPGVGLIVHLLAALLESIQMAGALCILTWQRCACCVLVFRLPYYLHLSAAASDGRAGKIGPQVSDVALRYAFAGAAGAPLSNLVTPHVTLAQAELAARGFAGNYRVRSAWTKPVELAHLLSDLRNETFKSPPPRSLMLSFGSGRSLPNIGRIVSDHTNSHAGDGAVTSALRNRYFGIGMAFIVIGLLSLFLITAGFNCSTTCAFAAIFIGISLIGYARNSTSALPHIRAAAGKLPPR